MFNGVNAGRGGFVKANYFNLSKTLASVYIYIYIYLEL